MIYGLYLSAAGALTENARHAVIANNIANSNTPGFKPDMAVVRARNPEAVEESLGAYATPMDRIGGCALVSETYTQHLHGPIEITGNDLDLAITGEGYFAVTDGQDLYYTRAGAFVRDTSGRLVTPDGMHFLADASGKPLLLPPEGEVSVAHDGTISIDGETAAKITTFTFSDKRALHKAGANRFVNRGAVRSISTAGIKQRALEASGVSVAHEISKMLLAVRAYEANMQLIQMQDQTISDLVNVGRVTV